MENIGTCPICGKEHKEAGKKLDVCVAKALGWEYIEFSIYGNCDNKWRGLPPAGKHYELVPNYSIDMNNAMTLWDETRLHDRFLLCADDTGFHIRHIKTVEMALARDMKVYHCDKPFGNELTKDEVPLYICLAYLTSLTSNRNPKSGKND